LWGYSYFDFTVTQKVNGRSEVVASIDLNLRITLKKILAILILSAYLMSSTELYQLLKIPDLIHHYFAHKALDEKMTLLEFLDLHYATGNEKEGDYAEDMKLPFKSTVQDSQSIQSMEPLQYYWTSSFIYAEVNIEICPIYRNDFLKPIYLSSIWQPPKFEV
jgi:hypothetical protein